MLIIVVFITPLTGPSSNPERWIQAKKEMAFIYQHYLGSGETLIMFCGFHFISNVQPDVPSEEIKVSLKMFRQI